MTKIKTYKLQVFGEKQKYSVCVNTTADDLNVARAVTVRISAL